MRRRFATALPLLGLMMLAAPALAKPVCFTEAEAEAEEAIRLHTELMVIGLTCQESAPAGQLSLFARYRQFTDQHQTAIRAWEKALIAHFKRVGKGSATKLFDSYRTSLANEISRRAIALSNPVFCAAYVPLAEKALTLTSAELGQRLSAPEQGVQVASLPRCDRPLQTLQVAASGSGESGPAR
ncbi:hypothetical protein [Indioceanicola profundi]|uniref:hypothetical protein n=1 Tax=Indioceanicola profundi TaxID=2220096 RepID=UPI000E6AD737|nr:hypothetical protein [Indioceanicola profundi]